MHIWDKYGDVAHLLVVKLVDALLKAMGYYGKASGDRHLALFAFVVYGLIVFPKALGYIERMMEMMTTIVKGKAKVGEGSGTFDNPIPFYNDTRVYCEDLLLQVPGVTIQIPRVNELPTSEE
ncbi:hypothetical protein PVK06_019573 [Gossypium arboreum]|uniref:Uncharacterized protein n=1 Tax=Gossypium arboreum TaxID=29729 RepID=A0ABR0PKC7_GOSAR|nr:hypothetical protein PVK06_019573 [Gossypium arboreum]